MRWIRAIGVLLAAGYLSGCLYEQPVAPGAALPVDARLLGTWKCVNPESEKVETLTVSERPDHRYRAEFAEGDAAPTVFAAYAVSFASEQLVNAQDIVEGEPRKWTLARITLHSPNVLRLEGAHHEPFAEAATPEQRQKVLAAGLKSGDLFEDFCVCMRAAEK